MHKLGRILKAMRYTAQFFALCICTLIFMILFYLNLSIRDPLRPPSDQVNSTAASIDLLEEFLKINARNQHQQNFTVSDILHIDSFSPQELQTHSTTTTLDGVAPCPSVPIVSVQDGGRLGNKIWEYAAVWSLARMLGRPGYVPQSLLNSIGKVFANLSLPAIEEIGHCHIQFSKPMRQGDLRPLDEVSDRFKGRNLLLHQWILFPDPVLLFRRQLHKEFKFRPEILRQVDETVRRLGGEGKVLVGVHVRRTDFATFLPKMFNNKLVGEEFFKEAMQWFRNNISGPLLFMIVSDDLEWCQQHLLDKDDVAIASKNPGHDLALLASSDHTIIDYGTFGEWGALMAGGHTIALNMDIYFNSAFSKDKMWHVFEVNRYQKEAN